MFQTKSSIYDPFVDYVRGKPKSNKLIYRPFADEQALAAALEAGRFT